MRTMLVSLTFVFLACTTAFGQCPCCTQRADLLRPSSRADATSQKSVIIKGERWANGSKIKVCFLSGSEPQRLAVVEAFLEWTKYANLDVEFTGASAPSSGPAVLDVPECDIRVRFKHGIGSYSQIGKSTRIHARLPVSFDKQGQPSGKGQQLETINFDASWWPEEKEYRFPLVAARYPELKRIAFGRAKNIPDMGTVLHEVGHALGLVHEHQHPQAGIKWNKDVVYKDMAKQGWSKEMVDQNIFPIADRNTHNLTVYDDKSVMVYSFPATWTTDGYSVKQNSELSEGDKEGIAKWYPGRWTPPKK